MPSRYADMYTRTTENICVQVRPWYRSELSERKISKYYFSYQVQIINSSEFDIRLLSRHWIIFDSVGVKRKVEGKGVIGQKPIIPSGDRFTYESWCPLLSEVGYMAGYYIIERLLDKSRHQIIIPRFHLITPEMKN